MMPTLHNAAEVVAEIEERFPMIAVGTEHGSIGECDCGAQHLHHQMQRAAGDQIFGSITFALRADEFDWTVEALVDLSEEQTVDEWGRTIGMPTRQIWTITGYGQVQAERDPSLPPPSPPRPADAVDEVAWTHDNPTEIIIRYWTLPYEREIGWGGWRERQLVIKLSPIEAEARWLACYMEHGTPGAESFRTKAEAVLYLRDEERMELSAPLGVYRRSDGPVPYVRRPWEKQ